MDQDKLEYIQIENSSSFKLLSLEEIVFEFFRIFDGIIDQAKKVIE